MPIAYYQLSQQDQYNHLLARLGQLEAEYWQNVVQAEVAGAAVAAGGDPSLLRHLEANVTQLAAGHAALVGRLTAFTAATGLTMPAPSNAAADAALGPAPPAV